MGGNRNRQQRAQAKKARRAVRAARRTSSWIDTDLLESDLAALVEAVGPRICSSPNGPGDAAFPYCCDAHAMWAESLLGHRVDPELDEVLTLRGWDLLRVDLGDEGNHIQVYGFDYDDEVMVIVIGGQDHTVYFTEIDGERRQYSGRSALFAELDHLEQLAG